MLDFSGRAAVSARVAAALCTLCVFVGRATLDPFDPLGALGAPAASVAAWLPSAVAASSAQDCTLPPSNFAVFQGAPFHTDQMGFLIEYFRLCHHNFSIFAGAEHASSALPVFARYYGRLNIRPAEDFLSAHADFAAAFLITPDERALPDALRQAEAARFVYLTHLALNGFVKRWMVLRLYTTPLAGVPATLPVFAAPAPVPADDRRKDVVFVGTIFDGQNVNVRDLVSLASHLAGASFSFVLFTSQFTGGDADHAALRDAGVVVRLKASTEEVHEAVRSAAFVLLFPSASSWYLTDRISGAHPMAVSLATPILTTTRFADIYGLSAATGAVAAGDAPSMAAAVAALAPRAYADLVAAAVAYRARHVRHNVRAIEDVLEYVPSLNRGAAGARMPLSERVSGRIIPGEARR